MKVIQIPLHCGHLHSVIRHAADNKLTIVCNTGDQVLTIRAMAHNMGISEGSLQYPITIKELLENDWTTREKPTKLLMYNLGDLLSHITDIPVSAVSVQI